MPKITWMDSYKWARYIAIGIAICGALSYWTADGTAVIGPDPESVEAERALIVNNTLWVSGIASVTALISGIMAYRNRHKLPRKMEDL